MSTQPEPAPTRDDLRWMLVYLRRFGRPDFQFDLRDMGDDDPVLGSELSERILREFRRAAVTQFTLARELRDWSAATEAVEQLSNLADTMLHRVTDPWSPELAERSRKQLADIADDLTADEEG